MSEVKGQCHMLYAVSIQCTSFSFHINPTDHSWDTAKIVLTLKKHIQRKFAKITVFNRISPKSNQVSDAPTTSESGRGRGSGARVYVDRLTNCVRGSRACKSFVVRSQVTRSIFTSWFGVNLALMVMIMLLVTALLKRTEYLTSSRQL